MSDPDYQAQFKRGYEGAPIVPTQVDRGGADAVGGGSPTVEVGSGAASDSEADSGTVAEPDPEPHVDTEPGVRGVNPWSIVLLVASLLMVAAGCGLLRLYATTNASGFGLADQTAVLLQSNLGGALLSAGIIGVIAWLVLLALRGTDRRGPA